MEPTREDIILNVMAAYEQDGVVAPETLRLMLEEARRLDALEKRMEEGEIIPAEEIMGWTQPEWTKRFGKLGRG